MSLKGKKILLGITGSIAAYKIAILIRLLKKQEAEVQVIATKSSLAFIPALTLSTLSENPVYSDFVKNEEGEWTNHVALGLWADVMLVAPLSAKSLASLANGYADSLLAATYLSARCPVLVAPAMDLDMYQHPSTQKNLAYLQEYGNTIIDATEGELASGLYGKGRMAEPEELLKALKLVLLHPKNTQQEQSEFTGKKVLITAGPTQEAIDPVRYISNNSSGKMGYALAKELLNKGAVVTLVSGPVVLTLNHERLNMVPVRSAKEMFKATDNHYPSSDIAIFTAAVSDYAPAIAISQKIKKQTDTLQLNLIKNPDIAKVMGAKKQAHQLNVGFALETHNGESNALEKLNSKNFDMIVLNSLQDKGAGFEYNTNQITIFTKQHKESFPLKAKTEVAKDILAELSKLIEPA